MPPWIDLRTPAVNPLGNNLNGYQSANWINLNAPTVLVDFTSLGVGTPLAAGTLPGGGTYTQAAGSNQTTETVQTSASTVALWAFVANLPRIGILADGGIGLVLEPPRTNLIPWSRDLASGTWQAESLTTVTSNVGVGPDGSSLADREQVSSTGFGRYRFDLVLTVSTAYYGSVWQRANSGTSSWQIDVNASGATNVNQWYGGASVSTTWERRGVGNTTGAAGTVGGLLSADGRDGSAAGGIAAGARDLWVDLHQFEAGKYPTNAIITAGTTASRAGFRVSIPISRYVRGGVFRAVLTTVPHGAATEYDGDSATIRLWTIDANTYAEVNTTTRVLTVSVNGVARVAGVPLWWLRGHRVQWSWEVGGGSLRVRYRYSTDQGATWTLPFDPFGGTVYSDSAISTASSTIDLYSDSGSSKWWGTGVVSEEAILTAPAWALQALPTDVASVKAFFRADSSYVLSAGLVSSWSGQTATAVTAFSQAAGAQQPAVSAVEFGAARPALSFDGANDLLESGPTSEWITATTGVIYVLCKVGAVSLANASAALNHTIIGDADGLNGISARTGPSLQSYALSAGYADTATQGFSLSTAMIPRWRHVGGNLYLRISSAAEGAGVVCGNTSSSLKLRVACGAAFANVKVAAIVAMNTDPTAGEDAAIMSFLNAYGGL